MLAVAPVLRAFCAVGAECGVGVCCGTVVLALTVALMQCWCCAGAHCDTGTQCSAGTSGQYSAVLVPVPVASIVWCWCQWSTQCSAGATAVLVFSAASVLAVSMVLGVTVPVLVVNTVQCWGQWSIRCGAGAAAVLMLGAVPAVSDAAMPQGCAGLAVTPTAPGPSLPGTAPGRYKWGRTLPRHGGHPDPSLISHLPARTDRRSRQALAGSGWVHHRGHSHPGVGVWSCPPLSMGAPVLRRGWHSSRGSPPRVQGCGHCSAATHHAGLRAGGRDGTGGWHHEDMPGDTGAQPVLDAVHGD